MKTFWYNPLGCDNNGNFGPDENTAGWMKIMANTYDDAAAKLPHQEQVKVHAALKKIRCSTLEDLLSDTAGWAIGFTLACQEHDEMSEFDSLPTTFTELQSTPSVLTCSDNNKFYKLRDALVDSIYGKTPVPSSHALHWLAEEEFIESITIHGTDCDCE